MTDPRRTAGGPVGTRRTPRRTAGGPQLLSAQAGAIVKSGVQVPKGLVKSICQGKEDNSLARSLIEVACMWISYTWGFEADGGAIGTWRFLFLRATYWSSNVHEPGPAMARRADRGPTAVRPRSGLAPPNQKSGSLNAGRTYEGTTGTE